VTAKLEHERPRYRLALTLGAIPLLAAAYGAVRIRQVDLQVAKAPKSRVAIVQANMSLAGKRENVMEGIARHVHLTQELRDSGGVDLAVWSETSDMRAVDEDIANSFYPSEFTRELGLPTIFGAILQRPVPDAREHGLLNTALVSDSSGKIIARYDKHSLLAFGEYMPFGDYVPALYGWLPQAGHYIPGTSLEPLKVIGHRIAVCICYEDIIPSFVNRMMRHTAPDLLVNMTNDAWFGDTTAPWIHVALAKFRAVEHRRYLVRATNSGVSAFVDPVGRITSHSSTFKQQYLKDDVAWITTTTPYELYGDVPWWLASVLAVGMSLLRRPERRRIANTAPEPVLDTAR
jgi:apolipoprotein N-acyltransferase